ncbi:monosaccharide-transporting ATPase [Brucella ceti M490/95/1]|nr:monosaccharide-transporting ATPase [Brucella ceti M490/95/1]
MGRGAHHLRARRLRRRGQWCVDRLSARSGLRGDAWRSLLRAWRSAFDDQRSHLQQSRRSPELGNMGFDWLGFNKLFGVPIGVLVLAILAIICAIVLNRTAFGRWLYASGGNERAAELSGVPVKRVKVSVYVISGICAAIAGLVLSSQLTSAGPTAGTTYELTAIAAVVIGGAALTGGRGTIQGTLLGAFVIGFLSDGLVIIGVSSYWQTVFTGAVIVLAVLLNSIQYSRR